MSHVVPLGGSPRTRSRRRRLRARRARPPISSALTMSAARPLPIPPGSMSTPGGTVTARDAFVALDCGAAGVRRAGRERKRGRGAGTQREVAVVARGAHGREHCRVEESVRACATRRSRAATSNSVSCDTTTCSPACAFMRLISLSGRKRLQRRSRSSSRVHASSSEVSVATDDDHVRGRAHDADVAGQLAWLAVVGGVCWGAVTGGAVGGGATGRARSAARRPRVPVRETAAAAGAGAGARRRLPEQPERRPWSSGGDRRAPLHCSACDDGAGRCRRGRARPASSVARAVCRATGPNARRVGRMRPEPGGGLERVARRGHHPASPIVADVARPPTKRVHPPRACLRGLDVRERSRRFSRHFALVVVVAGLGFVAVVLVFVVGHGARGRVRRRRRRCGGATAASRSGSGAVWSSVRAPDSSAAT